MRPKRGREGVTVAAEISSKSQKVSERSYGNQRESRVEFATGLDERAPADECDSGDLDVLAKCALADECVS